METDMDEKWTTRNIIEETIKTMGAHNEPSPQTIKMIEDTNNHASAMMNVLSDIKSSLAVNTNETGNIKTLVGEIKNDVKTVDGKVGFQNGRVTKLEEWAKEAQKILESTSDTMKSYSNDKLKVWTAMGLLLLLGGTIIGLSVMAINSKIKEGIHEALSAYETDK